MQGTIRQWIGVVCCILSSTALFAATLDDVTFKLSDRVWVNTDSALLKVNVHAALNDADIVKVRANVLNSLRKIAPGDWQITQFDRSQDNSGLEKLLIQSEIRVKESALTNVYQQATAVSKPGVAYTIASVEFKPSLNDLEKARARLREQLYQQAQAEIQRLNQVYTTQKYTLNDLVFVDGELPPGPMPLTRGMMNTMISADAQVPQLAMRVSNELIMTAIVRVASNRP